MNDEIRCLIIRRAILLLKIPRPRDSGIVFLAVDPNGRFKVLPVSQAVRTRDGIYTKPPRRSSCLLSLYEAKLVRKDLIEAHGQLYWGIRAGYGWMVRLSKIGNRWEATEAKIMSRA
jgi:hypothetical protein